MSMARRYGDEQREWLRENIPRMSFAEAAEGFSERFFPMTESQARSYAGNHGLLCGKRKRPACSIWDDERNAFIASVIPGRTEGEIRELFRERYGIELTSSQIANAKTRNGVRSGTHGGRFVKGQDAWNKGRPQAEWMSEESIEATKRTRFKKGESNNELPLGSEYVDRDGYVYVKVALKAGRNRFGRHGAWRPRSHIAVEGSGRKVGDRDVVIHLNGIHDDDRPENLEVVSMADNARLNSMGASYADRDTFDACMLVVGLSKAIAEKKRKPDGCER